jgi:hypothetical protein
MSIRERCGGWTGLQYPWKRTLLSGLEKALVKCVQ